ncbi:MAG: hypothetical protein M0Z69_16725 [Actinomycetota bacterium]|nr:hypothetical protein [Actinomycetota bacterium]
MTAGLEHVLVPLLEDHLHPLEQLRPDQGRVLAGMLDAAVADQTEVVAVP